jgi:spore coat protein U-like protein
MRSRGAALTAAFAVASLVAGSGPAFAGSSTATLTITATVVGNCTAITPNPGSIAFANYDPFTYPAGTPLKDATAAVFSTNCTQGDGISWTVGTGNNCGKGSVTADRAMTDGASHYLSYELYQNSSDTTAWAYGSNCGTPTAVAQTGGGSTTANTIDVYGLIPGGQNASEASYSDAVTVTVNF